MFISIVIFIKDKARKSYSKLTKRELDNKEKRVYPFSFFVCMVKNQVKRGIEK